jgi:hypothetical protein
MQRRYFHRHALATLSTVTASLLAAPSLSAQGATSLTPGTPVERQIAGARTDSYAVQLTKGQVLDATVKQNGIDVVVTVHGPDGRLIDRVDSPTGLDGTEHVRLPAPATGSYRIGVAPLETVAAAGKYTISVRPPTMASAAEQQVLDRERELEQALGARDTSALGRLLAANLTWINMRGFRVDRQALIASMASAGNKISIVPTQLRLQFFGDAAIVSGHEEIADSVRGTAVDRDFTRTWVQQNGRWLLASAQSTGSSHPIRSERVDPATLDTYVGQYRGTDAEANAGPAQSFTLTRKGDQLIFQRDDELMPLYAEAPGVFYTNNLQTRLIFVPGASGAGTQVMVLPYISVGRVQILRKMP